MKNITNLTFIILAISSLMTFSSCEKEDDCESITCYAGGTCVDGTCDCTTAIGYEGEFCEIEVNKKFEGFSGLMETCSNAQPRSVAITINPSNTSPTRIRIDGLVDGFFQADAFIDGAIGLDFTIPRAFFGIEEIEGNGSMSEDGQTITLTYSIYDSGSQTASYTCTGIITK